MLKETLVRAALRSKSNAARRLSSAGHAKIKTGRLQVASTNSILTALPKARATRPTVEIRSRQQAASNSRLDTFSTGPFA
jgi:hypothetical protein